MTNTTNHQHQRAVRRPISKLPHNTHPATHWRVPDAELQAFGTAPHVAAAAGQSSDHREVYAVVNHEGLQAIYHWKDDAVSHAKVCAGTVQTMRVNYELPTWVKVMVDRASDLAAMQNGSKTSSPTIH